MENLRKRFIVEENLEEKKITEYVERVLPFCKVTKNGAIWLGERPVTNLEKVKIALVARFLANRIEQSIPSEITANELSNSLEIPQDQIRARLKDVRDSKFAFSSENGKHKVRPSEIGKFLDELERKYGEIKK
jgi:hypothetical protein